MTTTYTLLPVGVEIGHERGRTENSERAKCLRQAARVGAHAGDRSGLVCPSGRRHSIERRIARCESRIRSIDDRWSAGIGRSSELADQAVHLAERAMELAARQAFESQLRQARSALQRVCQGQGDTCEACGARITQARLEAVPGTTMCVECQQKSEGSRM